MEVLKLAKEIKEGFQVPTVILPRIFKDDRGYFFESYNKKEFFDNVYLTDFVEENESKSSYGVLRGLHFQKPPYEQAKLVRVISGEAVDVAVDLRKDSPYYKMYFSALLSEENHRQFYIPPGFAHGFLALRDNTIFQYKCSNFYNKQSEGTVYYDDPEIGIPWGQWINPQDIKLSDKGRTNKFFEEIENPF